MVCFRIIFNNYNYVHSSSLIDDYFNTLVACTYLCQGCLFLGIKTIDSTWGKFIRMKEKQIFGEKQVGTE